MIRAGLVLAGLDSTRAWQRPRSWDVRRGSAEDLAVGCAGFVLLRGLASDHLAVPPPVLLTNLVDRFGRGVRLPPSDYRFLGLLVTATKAGYRGMQVTAKDAASILGCGLRTVERMVGPTAPLVASGLVAVVHQFRPVRRDSRNRHVKWRAASVYVLGLESRMRLKGIRGLGRLPELPVDKSVDKSVGDVVKNVAVLNTCIPTKWRDYRSGDLDLLSGSDPEREGASPSRLVSGFRREGRRSAPPPVYPITRAGTSPDGQNDPKATFSEPEGETTSSSDLRALLSQAVASWRDPEPEGNE